MSTEAKKPWGVFVVAALIGGGGLLGVVLARGSDETGLAILFCVLQLLLAVGLATFQRWARPTAIGAYVLNIIGAVVLKAWVAIPISLLLIRYLSSPEVKAAFATGETGSLPPAATEATSASEPLSSGPGVTPNV